ncbi:hypothetical protein HAALTHF_53690n [Vreelandella aquamarina]|nr:hypothetical protein HAALTHF_53690n [Halomonas axialensis]
MGVSGSMVLGGKTFVLNAVETAIGKDSNKTGGEESGERTPPLLGGADGSQLQARQAWKIPDGDGSSACL